MGIDLPGQLQLASAFKAPEWPDLKSRPINNLPSIAGKAHYKGQAMKLVTGLLALVSLIVDAMVWGFWGEAGPDLFHVLGTEDSPKTWISSSLLVASGTAAALVGAQNALRSARYGWYLIALGLLGMAADDRFMGHERLKEWLFWGGLSRWLEDSDKNSRTFFR